MSHFPLERLAEAMRADGVEVDILPGAQGRSARMWGPAGYPRGCQAVVEHHTASSGLNPLGDIGYILNGKGDGYVISNAYTWRTSKKVTLIASGPTYTEGRGGPLGIIPENGGNTVSFSNEIAHPGDNSPYPLHQQDAVASLAYHAGIIAAELWGWPDDPFSPQRAFAHFEWTSRKIDPHGTSRWSPQGGKWDMDAFRAELAGRVAPTPPPNPEEPDMGMRVLRLRIIDEDGTVYNDQVVASSIANPEALFKMGVDDVPMMEAKIEASRAEIESVLGYPLTPS